MRSSTDKFEYRRKEIEVSDVAMALEDRLVLILYVVDWF